MTKVIEGQLSAADTKFGIVAGRFNGFVVSALVDGAQDAIRRMGGSEASVSVYWAPGAFEIPQVLGRVLSAGNVDAVICLGAVIRGATPHFEHVAGAVTRGVSTLARGSDIPVAFGVLTCDTIEQAIERAGSKAGNKGFDAAMAAIEMLSVFRQIGS